MGVRNIQGITYSPPVGIGNNNSIGWDGKDPAEQFLKLLVSQITNQDPDRPVDSTAMITQFAQIQSALATHAMTQAAQTFQRVHTAGNLLNQNVSIFDREGKPLTEGRARGIDFSGPMPFINVGGQMYPLDAVRKVGEI